MPGAPLPGKKQMELLPSLRTFHALRSNLGLEEAIGITRVCKTVSQCRLLPPKELLDRRVKHQPHLVDQPGDQGVEAHG